MKPKTKYITGILGSLFLCTIAVILYNRAYDFKDNHSGNKNEPFDKDILERIDKYIGKSYGVLISQKAHLIGDVYSIDKIIKQAPDLPYAYFLKFQYLVDQGKYCKDLALQIHDKFPEYPQTYLILAKLDPKNGIKYLFYAFQLTQKDTELIKIIIDFILNGSYKETELYWPIITKQIIMLSNEQQEILTIYLLKKLYQYRFVKQKSTQIIRIIKKINTNYEPLLLCLPESEIYRDFVEENNNDAIKLHINEHVFKVLSDFFYEEARFVLALFYSSKVQEMFLSFSSNDLSVFRMHRWSGFSTSYTKLFKNLAAQYNYKRIVEIGDNIEFGTLTPSTFTILGLAYIQLSQTIGELNIQAKNLYRKKYVNLLADPIAKEYQAESYLLQANYLYLNKQKRDAYKYLLLWDREKGHQNEQHIYNLLIKLFSIDESMALGIQEIAVKMDFPLSMIESLKALVKISRERMKSQNASTIRDDKKDILMKFTFELYLNQSEIDYNKHVMDYEISKENMVVNSTNAALLNYYMCELIKLESYVYRIPNQLVYKTNNNSSSFLSGSLKLTKKDLIRIFNIDEENINNGVYFKKLNKKRIEASRIFNIGKYFYWDKGDVDQAIVMIEECLKRDPDFFDAIILKAELEIYQGKLDQALKSIKRAEEIGILSSEQLNMKKWVINSIHKKGHSS